MRLALLLLVAGTAMAADLVLIVHKRADSVGVYDDATGASVATIPVGVKPHEMALTADRKFLFVTNYGLDSYESKDAGGNTISVVDMAQRKVTATIDLGRYRRPHGIERGSSGRMYVTTEVPAALHIIDPAERRVIRSIDTPGKLPHMVVVSEDEKRAYLANAGSGTVTVVDLKSGGTGQTKVGGVPMGLALSSDGYRLYVATRGANVIALISTDMMNVVHRIELKGQPARAHLVNSGRYLLVSLIGSGELALVDTQALGEVKRIPVGKNAEGIGVGPGERFVYVSAQAENRVLKFSLKDLKQAGEFKTADRPDPILVLPEAQ